MRSIWEIIEEECRAENPDASIDEKVYKRRWIRIALKKYAEEVLDEVWNGYDLALNEEDQQMMDNILECIKEQIV